MALEIENSVADHLPSVVKEALSKMPPEKQSQFVEDYKRKSKSFGLMLALAIFFPIQLFLLGKTGLGVAYLLTAGGCGIWWIVEIFLTKGRVNSFNEDLARTLLRDMKIMG